MIEILSSIKGTIPLLLTIFVAVFFVILLTRLIFLILFHFAKKKYEALKRKNPFKRSSKKRYEKEEDELLRAIPKAHSAERAHNLAHNENYALVESSEQQMEKEAMSQVSIVDIVKPIGFWTSMILGQKLTYLIQSAQTINKRGKQGFWVSMIEAQEQAAGKQHGRGR